MKKLILIACFVLLFPTLGLAANHYVECGLGSGNDDGTTPANAFKTLTSANNHSYLTGDDVYFKAGSECTLSGTGLEDGLDIDWTGSFDNIAIIGCYVSEGNFDCTGSTKPLFTGVLAEEGTAIPSTYKGIIHLSESGGTWEYTTIQDLHFKKCGGYCIRYDNATTNSNNITVQRNILNQYDRAAVLITRTNNSTITENTVFDGPIDISGGGSLVISGNHVADGDGAYNNTVSYNTVYQCRECINLWNGTRNNVIEYNVIYDSHDMGIYAASGIDNQIRYNLIYYTDDWNSGSYLRDAGGSKNGIRILLEDERGWCFPTDMQVYGNFMAGGDYGFFIGCEYCVVSDATCWQEVTPKIYDNTLIDFAESFHFSTWTGNSGANSSAIEIKNNLSYHTSADCQGSACVHSNSDSPNGVTWDTNLFSTDDDTVGGSAATNQVTDAPDLVRDTSYYNQAPGTFDIDDFKQEAGSGSIDKGLDLTDTYRFDYWLTNRDTYTPWDIGAHEFEGTPPSTSGAAPFFGVYCQGCKFN